MASRISRQRVPALVATLLLALPSTLIAAAQASPAYTSPLEHGALRVWILRSLTPAERLVRDRQRAIAAGAVTLPTAVQGQTTGSFGQTAGSFGQTAGSYGQTTGNLGQTSSSAGQTAGSYGQTVSQLGTAASNVGQTAGSYQGSIPSLNSLYPDQVTQPDSSPRDPLSRRSAELLAELQGQFPFGRLQFTEIPEDSFRDLFLGAGPESLPDAILAADALPDWWNASAAGLSMLGWPPPAAPGDSLRSAVYPVAGPGPARLHEAANVVIPRRAPHPAEARAFVVWLRDDGLCRRCEDPSRSFMTSPATATPAALAKDALGRLLTGNEPGPAADAAAARANPLLVQSLTLLPAGSDEPLPSFNIKIDVLNVAANDRLAEVALRGIVDGPEAFGVVHALVILRRAGNGGPWKVLQVTANLLPRELMPQGAELLPFLKPDAPARVVGVAQAAPLDGDSRPPHPDLWWDSGGGDGLLVVEWQLRYGTEWSDAHLMMVPDRESRARTRVNAAFAESGEYRWRVWAVGTGGALVLGPWRRFIIVP